MNGITDGFTREAWIEKRVAEGFTQEQAGYEYDKYTDPAVAEAGKQVVPTRADEVMAVRKAFANNPNHVKLYKPDFSLTTAYQKLHKELKDLKGKIPYDDKKAQELNSQMLRIKLSGTVSDEERQAEIDKTLEMPVAQLIAQRNKYKKAMDEYTEKIDNFDYEAVQAKADAISDDYSRKLKGKSGIAYETISAEYDKEVTKLEYEQVVKPLNDLAVKRYEAKEYFLIYEARVKYFVTANKELIEEEIQQAKREEVRGSLVDLAEYVEA